MSLSVPRRQELRLRFLYRLYTLSEGDTRRWFRAGAVRQMLDAESHEGRLALRYLEEVGLIVLEAGMAGRVSMTEAGLMRIQSALSHPNGLCHGFPSLLDAGILTAAELKARHASMRRERTIRLVTIVALYEMIDGDLDASVRVSDLRQRSEVDQASSDEALIWMDGASTLMRRDETGSLWVGLTLTGLLEAERALTQKDGLPLVGSAYGDD